METKNEITNGYYLKMKVSGGGYEDSWEYDSKSWFVEENGKGLNEIVQIIEQILDESNAEFDYDSFCFYENDSITFNAPIEGHWENHHFMKLKSSAGLSVYCFSEWNYGTDSINFILYDAVKIGDKIFSEVKILDESRMTPELEN